MKNGKAAAAAREQHRPRPSPPPGAGAWVSRWAPVVLFVAGVAAYANALNAPFVFDGRAMLDDARLHQLWPPTALLSGNNRPVGLYSFALDYALYGRDVRGYHLTNIAVHCLAAWLLFAVARRALKSPRLAPRYAAAAAGLALAIALWWLVHPLQTESVANLYQRYESLMGLCYLATLYAFLRAQEASRPWPWYVASIVAFMLGLGTKEVAATAPLVVLLFDRTLVAPSWRALWRERWAYYLPMFALVLVPLAYVLWHRGMYESAGVLAVEGVSPWDYARTQPAVILHYFRLSLWPQGLCFDYAWPAARTPGEYLPALLALAVLLALFVAAAWRAPAVALVGAWIFLILAPTSSFLPINDFAYEHRMYLPLAGVIALAVIAGYELLRRLLARWRLSAAAERAAWIAAAAAPALALLLVTHERNKVYANELTLWQDTIAKAPHNPRGLYNLGMQLAAVGRYDEAIDATRASLRDDPGDFMTRLALANYLLDRDPAGAIEQYERALQIAQEKDKSGSEVADAHLSLARAYAVTGAFDQALAQAQRAVDLRPKNAAARVNLANVLAVTDATAAQAEYQTALALDPRSAEAHMNLAILLVRDDPTAAYRHFQTALEIAPDSAEAHLNLANFLVTHGGRDEAIEHLRRAVALRPDNEQAQQNLRALLGRP